MSIIFLFLLGLITGSFLSMFTYRLPREMSFGGRSFCDHCGKKITWLENIPLLSYLFIKGKCKDCNRHISLRYPLIELLTALSFVFVYFIYQHPVDFLFFLIQQTFGPLGLIYVLILLSLFISLFVIDLETQILPDKILRVLLILITIFCFMLPSPLLFQHLIWGFISASFFLLIYLLTKERGLGFGDVKLGFVIGFLLGFPHTIVWILLSFISGSIVGIIMLILRMAKLGQPIPFGPFLIASALITLIYGGSIFIWYITFLIR
jgi:prepilin signal peptidase PulO-like enzyme (type II secretory pathway)